MKKKSLGLNAFLNGIRNICNIIFPIITFPYISRILKVRQIGIFNFSNSFVGYFLLLAELGVNTYAIREGAKYRDNKKKIAEFVSEVFTVNLVSTIISYILLIFSVLVFAQIRNYSSYIFILSAQIFFQTIGTEWLYQIYEDYAFITFRSVIIQIISIILLFVFVKNSNDFYNYIFITLFSTVGANILNFIFARQYCKIKIVFNFNWKEHLIPILFIFASNVATTIYVNSDITLLGLMENNYIVGIYSVSTKIYQIVKNLLAAVLTVTVPRLAMLFGKKLMKEYTHVLTGLVNTLLIISLPVSVGLFMLAKEVILIISGTHYLRAEVSLRILCIAFIFAVFAWTLTGCVLIPAKREKLVLISTIISAGVNIIFNLLFIPYMQENAAAISTVLAEMSMFIINGYFAKDIIGNLFRSRKIIKNLVTSLIGCIGIVIVCLCCERFIQSMILKTIGSIFLSVIIYAFILILTKNELAVELLTYFKIMNYKK